MRFSGLNPTLLTRKYADEKSNDDNFLKYLQFFKTKNQFLILKGFANLEICFQCVFNFQEGSYFLILKTGDRQRGWVAWGGQTSLQEEAGAQVATVTHKNKNEKSNFALVGN